MKVSFNDPKHGNTISRYVLDPSPGNGKHYSPRKRMRKRPWYSHWPFPLNEACKKNAERFAERWEREMYHK